MDLYEFMRRNAKNGAVILSVKQASQAFSMTESKIRLDIRKLIRDGYITPVRQKKKDGGDKANQFLLTGKKTDVEYDANMTQVRSIYCKYASQRSGKKFNPVYAFAGYASIFKRIVDMCKAEELNIHIYILACFHAFPGNWCRAKFNQSFPPPFILASKKNALDRYEGLLRYIKQYSPEKTTIKDFNEQIRDCYNVWRRIGVGDDIQALAMLVNNGTVMIEFFLALPFIHSEHVKYIHKKLLNSYDLRDVERAKNIIERCT